jgi:septin family protein
VLTNAQVLDIARAIARTDDGNYIPALAKADEMAKLEPHYAWREMIMEQIERR